MKRKMEEGEWKFAPPWCSRICVNANNEACNFTCSVSRDCSWFEPKTTDLAELPPFPLHEFMEETTNEERKAIVGIYLAAITTALQGVPGQAFKSGRSSPISSVVEVNRLQHDNQTGTTVYPSYSEKISSPAERVGEMAAKSNGKVK